MGLRAQRKFVYDPGAFLRLLKNRGISDQAVLDAMAMVPREHFVGLDLAEFAYDDTPLPIEEGQTISQPYIVALMTEALRGQELGACNESQCCAAVTPDADQGMRG